MFWNRFTGLKHVLEQVDKLKTCSGTYYRPETSFEGEKHVLKQITGLKHVLEQITDLKHVSEQYIGLKHVLE